MSYPWFIGGQDDLTDDDKALIRSGAYLRPGMFIVLPSGRKITSDMWAYLGGVVHE